MVERHYDEEALISLMEAGHDAADAHLPSCTLCAEKLESFRMIADALHDRDVWDTHAVSAEPVPATIANLRSFADRMSIEDRAASDILTELLSGARETWMPRLRERPEWRTAGVVRALIESTNRAIDTMPPDALEATALATAIADGLEPAEYPSDTVYRLRGMAWRDRGYAFFYCGDPARALEAVERAEAAFAHCAVDSYDRARVGIVKALSLQLMEQFTEAADVAGRSAATFRDFQDSSRAASAQLTVIHILFGRGDYKTAELLLADMDCRLASSPDVETHARVVMNRGYCAQRLGKTDQALSCYELAGALFEALDIPTETIRVRWNATLMLAEAGRLTDASVRLEKLSADMERMGMASEATLNALHVAEFLLADGRHEQVEHLCRLAMERFERAGLGYTTRALTALAYIREAAQHRIATPVLVRSVREYIAQLPSRPNLLFAPPSDGF